MKDLIFAIDMDRTLTREDAVNAALERASLDVGIDVEAMHEAQFATESAGESFQPLDYLSSQLTTEAFELLKDRFKHYARTTGLLYDDVHSFFDALHKGGAQTIILTYGPQDWQQLKLEAAGLHERFYLITDTKQKGPLIAAWRKGNHYRVGGLSGKSVVLVDDKAMSFNDLPEDCTGFLIRRPYEAIVPSQQGSTLDSVTVIPHLMHAILVHQG